MIKEYDVCPSCYKGRFKRVSELTNTGGFSAGKAAVGAVLLGPVGLLGGALGKKRKYVTYQCSSCGYQVQQQE